MCIWYRRIPPTRPPRHHRRTACRHHRPHAVLRADAPHGANQPLKDRHSSFVETYDDRRRLWQHLPGCPRNATDIGILPTVFIALQHSYATAYALARRTRSYFFTARERLSLICPLQKAPGRIAETGCRAHNSTWLSTSASTRSGVRRKRGTNGARPLNARCYFFDLHLLSTTYASSLLRCIHATRAADSTENSIFSIPCSGEICVLSWPER
jgi:hypothetical protein